MGLLPSNLIVGLQVRLHFPLDKKMESHERTQVITMKICSGERNLLLGRENCTRSCCRRNRFRWLRRLDPHQSAELLVFLSISKIGCLPFIPAGERRNDTKREHKVFTHLVLTGCSCARGCWLEAAGSAPSPLGSAGCWAWAGLDQSILRLSTFELLCKCRFRSEAYIIISNDSPVPHS